MTGERGHTRRRTEQHAAKNNQRLAADHRQDLEGVGYQTSAANTSRGQVEPCGLTRTRSAPSTELGGEGRHPLPGGLPLEPFSFPRRARPASVSRHFGPIPPGSSLQGNENGSTRCGPGDGGRRRLWSRVRDLSTVAPSTMPSPSVNAMAAVTAPVVQDRPVLVSGMPSSVAPSAPTVIRESDAAIHPESSTKKPPASCRHAPRRCVPRASAIFTVTHR